MTNETEQQETIQEPENSLPAVTLADLPPEWTEAVKRAGWPTLMPVQAKAMPYIVAGRDIMVQSRTGSGKTGAFLLPALDRINRYQASTQVLVLAPTRELAAQVAREAEVLAGDSGVRITAVYGGVGYGKQLAQLREGAHLVVGTPGRILDHLKRGTLKLDNLKLLIFDEADRLLSMGFFPDMRRLYDYLPKKVQCAMFSATFPASVLRLADLFLTNPDFLGLSRDGVHVAETEHIVYEVASMDKDRSLIRIIEFENPESAIIFCNTKVKVHYVNVVLRRFGYNADELSADLPQNARDKVMKKLREGKVRFLVATDVAARGIDISDLSHVFIYEVPEDPEQYIHRAGRTGRAGAAGTAVTLIDGFIEKAALKRIQTKYNIDFETRTVPSEEDVANLVSQRLTSRLEAQLRERDKLKVERMERFLPLAKSLAESEELLPLVAMLLDDTYQQMLHQPPETLDVSPPEKEQARQKPKKRRRGRGRGRRGGK